MAVKLTNLNAGEKARVLKINGRVGIKRRLQAMGIFPGIDIKIIQSISNGPVIIESGNTRIAIGWDMAEKVEVNKNE
ncbi:MAG: ferrous iron transport protein A [Candidatus Goldbacteria bacterium]|nr:ferrous iron transport protein A [Candidatus Goldiibacteriota bacterium]